MAAPQLSPVLSLSDAGIDSEVTKTSAGVYALDKTSSGHFTVSHVGRSETDLNQWLHRYVGRYQFFKYAYCSSAKGAFEAECELFHDYNPPENVVHPARQINSGWKCPRCFYYG